MSAVFGMASGETTGESEDGGLTRVIKVLRWRRSHGGHLFGRCSERSRDGLGRCLTMLIGRAMGQGPRPGPATPDMRKTAGELEMEEMRMGWRGGCRHVLDALGMCVMIHVVRGVGDQNSSTERAVPPNCTPP